MAMKPLLSFLLAILMAGTSTFAAQGRQVAITIDDLPRGGDGGPTDPAAVRSMSAQLLQPFRVQKIPVTGFVNAARWKGDDAGLSEILNLWLDAGAELGNHSFSHPDINSVSLDVYLADILKGEPAIRSCSRLAASSCSITGTRICTRVRPQRSSLACRRSSTSMAIVVAPVTIDDADYMFAAAYMMPEFRERARREYVPYMESVVTFFEQRSIEVTGHEVAQILLIHASQLNAELMPDLLRMFRRRGYEFVSLSQALKDPAYSLPDAYAGRGGFSWIHRWSLTKGMKPKGEPDPPEWAQKAFEQRQ